MASRRRNGRNKKTNNRQPNKTAFRRDRNENRLGMIAAFLAIMTLVVVVGINSISLKQKNTAYAAREQELIAQIAEEDARTQELEELSTYTQTKKYAEEVAKDKLGLVYENEIIFQESN